ncbi:MAG TPA: N-acyl homoserine lactonase family protein [Burkholderiales bacterium]
MSLTPYEIYAIRYATVVRKHAGENFIGADPHEHGGTMDYFVWLVRNAERSFVIDSGFTAAVGRKRGREFLRCPSEGLAALGLPVDQVKDVVVTHLHYDHIGNFALFPNAVFHLQDREMAYATGRHMASPVMNAAYEVEDITAMVREVYRGRVRFYNGDTELAPGLTLHHVGGHTDGLQIVRVWTQHGWMVLASDATHYYANMEEQRLFPIVFDVGAMVEGWRRCRELADAPQYVIPGHDPEVLKRYPASGPGKEGWIARLDVEPRP